jgi:hypothetical protein
MKQWLVVVHQYFGTTCQFHLQGFRLPVSPKYRVYLWFLLLAWQLSWDIYHMQSLLQSNLFFLCNSTLFHRTVLKCWHPAFMQAWYLLIIFLNTWQSSSLEIVAVSHQMFSFSSLEDVDLPPFSLLWLPWIMVLGLISGNRQNLFLQKMGTL